MFTVAVITGNKLYGKIDIMITTMMMEEIES